MGEGAKKAFQAMGITCAKALKQEGSRGGKEAVWVKCRETGTEHQSGGGVGREGGTEDGNSKD